MEFWLPIWKWTLILGATAFAVLSVVVIIGGAYDIRSLFRSLRAQHEQQDHPGDGALPRVEDGTTGPAKRNESV